MQRRRPHPFAIEPAQPAMRWRWVVGLIGLGLIAAAFLPDLGRRWVASRWIHDLESLPGDEQQMRLTLLPDLGEPGIEVLVQKMLEPDPSIALAAYRVLAETQDDWATRFPERADRMHYTLMAAIEAKTSPMPADRRAWIEQLSGQTLMDTLQSETSQGEAAYAAAIRLLAKCAPPGSLENPEALTRGTLRIATKPSVEPMLVPPDPIPSSPATNLENDQPPVPALPIDSSPMVNSQNRVPLPAEPPAQLVTPNTTLRIAPLMPQIRAMSDNTSSPSPASTPVSALPAVPFAIDSLTPYQTRELIDLLHGSSEELKADVRNELKRRGFNEAAMQAAEQLAAGDTRLRLQLIGTIAKRTDIDPRPFLLWLSEDPDRQVRVAAINLLATLNDPLVRRSLQEQLNVEADPVVATQLRIALGR